MTAVEAIWKVSEDSTNLNHIIIEIHGQNQFTFNVSIVLLLAALGNLCTTVKSNTLSLVKLDDIVDRIVKLDIFNDKNDRQIMGDFLCLFQTFQRLLSTAAARDDSLRHVLILHPNQLKRVKTHLQTVLQGLNKTINDQTDLKNNTTISYCIQLVLSNMDSIDTNLF